MKKSWVTHILRWRSQKKSHGRQLALGKAENELGNPQIALAIQKMSYGKQNLRW